MEDLKVEAIHRIEAAVNKLNRIWNSRVPMPEVVFIDGNHRVAGTANYSKHRIEINTKFLTHEKFFDYSQGGETCEHEVGHLFTKILFPHAKQAHGPEFRRVMASIGLTGRTRHSMHLEDAPKKVTFSYKCDCRTHQLSKIRHGKIQRGTKYYCLDCKGHLHKV